MDVTFATMAQPLSVIVQSVSGFGMTLSVDPSESQGVLIHCYPWEVTIHEEIEKSGVPKNQQILVHESKVLLDETESRDLEEEEAVTLRELLVVKLDEKVTTLSLTLVKRDPVVAEWLSSVKSWDCSSLEEAPDIVRRSEEVILAGMRRSFTDVDKGNFVRYASPEVLADKTFMLKVVKLSGDCLQYAAKALKADRDVVKTAVAQDGRSLEFVSDDLKSDEEIVLEALKQTGAAKALKQTEANCL